RAGEGARTQDEGRPCSHSPLTHHNARLPSGTRLATSPATFRGRFHMANLISDYLGIHAQAMPLREQRMKLIASNLSNADTPGYKARDLDFDAALRHAQVATGNGLMTTTAEQHYGI